MGISRLISCRWLVAGLALVLGVVAGGCTKYDGVSDVDRLVAEQKKGADPLVAQGGKAERKSGVSGDAWVVHLDGMTITGETIGHLKQVDKISELHLGRSTVTDDQIAAMRDQNVFNVTLVLDLSHTAVTDAALDKLSDTPGLAQLTVTGTKVTPAGITRFKQARQNNPQVFFKTTKVTGP